jgi:hypothetical protein
MQEYRPYERIRTTNATNTSFASKVPTITEPSGDGIRSLCGKMGGTVPCKAFIVPFGTGDANDVFDMRVIGWTRIGSGTVVLWIPTIIASFTCTLGAATGVAGAPVVATELFCDTIVILSEPTVTADVTRTGTVSVYSPAADLIGLIELNMPPVEKLEFSFDATTGDPSGMNALVALVH